MDETSLFEFVYERLPELGILTIEHLLLTGASIFIAVVLGLPFGIWITRNALVRGWVLGFAGIVQTIPSLAMLAFLLPFLGTGAKPAIVALTLYALLPMIRNTYTGLTGVSPNIIEASKGVGFTNRQRLWMIELPLATPVIVAGIRTATVICVGIATLSAFIGAGGLGVFINRGLAQTDNRLILLGAIPAAILALLLDTVIGQIEQMFSARIGMAPKMSTLHMALVLLIVLLLICGVVWGAMLQFSTTERSDVIRVGSKNYTEQFILGELLSQLIEEHTDLQVERHFNLGGTMICHGAMINGELDLYAEYTGTGLMSVLQHDVVASATKALEIVRKEYREQFSIQWLKPFGFNNPYAITVRKADAQRNGWETITDLRPMADRLRAGFTAEFAEREDGYLGLSEVYDLEFQSVKDFDPGLMYQAIHQNEVDVISAFATDARILEFDLKPLEDDKMFFPPYFAAPIVRQEVLDQYPFLKKVLNKLSGELDNDTMLSLNNQVDTLKRAPQKVARQFLLDRQLVSE